MSEAVIQRFLGKVDFTDTCWLWQASLDGKGYGQFSLDGGNVRSHRLSYLLFKGDPPAGHDLDHLCRVRSCINPEHLEAVTRSTNLLRGELWQSKKTHCPNGHEYDYIDSRGARRCKRCMKSRMQRIYIEKKRQYA